MDARVKPAHDKLIYELPAEFFFYMDTNDIIESPLGSGKAKTPRAAGVEVPRPAVDNADDERVRLAFDPRRDLVARYTLQCRDLFADGGRQPRHGEVAPRAGGSTIHGRCMN